MTSLELTRLIVKTLDNKKAEDIQAIKVRDLTILADYFIVANGTSNTQVKALVDEADFVTSQLGRRPTRIEKDLSANWIILDYSDVVVHIFYKETREFYNIERLWSDGERLSTEDLIK